MEWTRDSYLLVDDQARVDVDAVHAFLTTSYWAEGVPREVVERSVQGSLCFSLFLGDEQVGFVRAITDSATFAYLCDVYVLPAHRGRGLARWMIASLAEHPRLRSLRRWLLATRDAHGLYEKLGFTPLSAPERFMERLNRDGYRPRS
ncbi:MAG TPA: GNAT family N-acetyltransferase [Myxococcales bacterium]|nr:GNAT family N-acetyltransferase [Myxococcales bacterium]